MDLQRLAGTVEAVTYQNEESGFAVLSLSDEHGELICVVGRVLGAVPGEMLVLEGSWKEHASYGVQFEAVSCSYKLPEEQTELIKYLSSGVLPGIGPAMARRIVEKFGTDSLEVISSSPEKLAQIRGFGLEKAKKASARFNEMFGLREAMAYMSSLSLSGTEAAQIYKIYGENTQAVIKQNPYLLCSSPLFLSFHRVDEIARKLSVDMESPRRTQAAIIYTARHNMNNGHSCLPWQRLIKTVSDYFRIPPENVEEEAARLQEEEQAFIYNYEECEYFYLADSYRAEMVAAAYVKQMLMLNVPQEHNADKEIEILGKSENLSYAPKQYLAINEALNRRIMVITGGPGTGKTTTVNAVISCFEAMHERVMLCAPTGRAAKRLSELTGKKASTIHRLLEVGYAQGSSERPRFTRNDKNPLRCDVLIVDEMSMVDCFLFESLLLALRPGCRLILVGDTDQLPSVGPGNVLKGLIDSGVVPVVELKDIFRQAAQSLIVTNSHKIVMGELPEKGTKEDDFFFVKSYGNACRQLVCDLVSRRLPQSYGYNAVNDIQVLCPGRKGPLGTEILNEYLQEILNPPSVTKAEIKRMNITFRNGDKVMQVKNNYDLPYTATNGEPGAGAYNGDIGTICEVNPSNGSLTVMCEDRYVYYTSDNLHELEHAYAITIHKSQGSEFEAIVIPVAEVPQKLRYRNLLYTAVTRAKKLCVLVGEEDTLLQMVENGRRNIRFSCFSGFLADENII